MMRPTAAMRAPKLTALAAAAAIAALLGAATSPGALAATPTTEEAMPPPAEASAGTPSPTAHLPQATPRSLRAEVSPSQVRLGEPFTLTIEVTDQASERYELARDFTLGKEVDVLEIQPARTPLDGGLEATRFTLRAALFELGERTLPALRLTATGPEGDKLLEIDGPKVTCVGAVAEGEEADFADILPPVRVGIPSYLVLWVLLAALAALGLFFAGVRLFRRLRARPRKAPPPRPLDPLHVRALTALHALREEDLPGQGRTRELFFRLSEIERGYLGERYGFGALDMTTDELVAALGRLHTPGLDFGSFERHCREGDFVRFAKAPVPAAACKQALEDAVGLVQATTPPDATAAEKGKRLLPPAAPATPATSAGRLPPSPPSTGAAAR